MRARLSKIIISRKIKEFRCTKDLSSGRLWHDGGLEVDYVLRRGERLAAIEVKTNAEASTDGLAEFRRRFRPAASLIVGPAGMSLAEFLALDPAELLR